MIVQGSGILNGDSEDDFIFATPGNTGNDRLFGGEGDDLLVADSDFIYTFDQADVSIPLSDLSRWSSEPRSPDFAGQEGDFAYTTIVRDFPADQIDVFSFFGLPDQRVIIDIDYGDHFIGGDVDTLVQIFRRDLADIFSEDAPFAPELIDFNDDANRLLGGNGSLIFNPPFSISLIGNNSLDSFLSLTLPDFGIYDIVVSSLPLQTDFGFLPPSVSGNRLRPIGDDETYILNLAVEGQSFDDSGFVAGDDFLSAGGGSDILYSGPGDDFLSGAAGSDILYGGPGDDTLEGGTSNDRLFGEGGSNRVDGGEGTDTAFFEFALNEYTLDTDGDLIILTRSDEVNEVINVESLEFSDRTLTGNSLAQLLGRPTDLADRITGTVGRDVIEAMAGDDEIFGLGGRDVLHGEDGRDRLDGGRGQDSLFGGKNKDFLYGGGGRDQLFGGEQEDELFGGRGRDELDGGSGRNQLFGGGGNDELIGGANSDELFGGNGRDALTGGRGTDLLAGDNGRDSLDGGGGNDTLEGGRGADIMTGGTGADRFVFGLGDGLNRITDFSVVSDEIEITSGARSFEDLRISQQGEDALVAFGNVRVIFEGRDVDSFQADDFIFS